MPYDPEQHCRRSIRLWGYHLPGWQCNYYEHIVRHEDELNHIRDYIGDNPARWKEDENPPDNIK